MREQPTRKQVNVTASPPRALRDPRCAHPCCKMRVRESWLRLLLPIRCTPYLQLRLLSATVAPHDGGCSIGSISCHTPTEAARIRRDRTTGNPPGIPRLLIGLIKEDRDDFRGYPLWVTILLPGYPLWVTILRTIHVGAMILHVPMSRLLAQQ